MDESLSDFQETKQNPKGPKVHQKSTKPINRKIKKHIKGQKDIRAVLKRNKNELISYSKEFDNVCKHVGLDVDSEQLQLAVALSKSLQNDTPDATTSQSLTAQGRLAKIRTTLQEYGFKVPETKIYENKKVKKRDKPHKLITTTKVKKDEIIIRKYSQVLFECLDTSKTKENLSYNEYDTPIFHIATYLPYDNMKDNNKFYVNNLIEKSNTSGSMLRDWAEIPGRPVSPILCETSEMEFSQLSCSQNELDVILSGSIKAAKNIFARKKELTIKELTPDVPKDKIQNEELNDISQLQSNCQNDDCVVISEKINTSKESNFKSPLIDIGSRSKIEIIDLESTGTVIMSELNRCCSPDLFADDVSSIMEMSTKPSLSPQGQKTTIFTEDHNFMDLTGCANNECLNMEKPLLISQNKTKRISDDFMELTPCAVSMSHEIQDEKEIDLTQSSDENPLAQNKRHLSDSSKNQLKDDKNIVVLDNKQNCHRNNTVSAGINIIQNYDKKANKAVISADSYQALGSINNEKEIDDIVTVQSAEDNIDLTQSSGDEDMRLNKSQDKEQTSNICESLDLTQSSKSSVCLEDLPEIQLNRSEELCSHSNDTIIINDHEYTAADKTKRSFIVQDDQVYGLTQTIDKCMDNVQDEKYKNDHTFYDDFVYNHSDSPENSKNININVSQIDINIHDSSNDSNVSEMADKSSLNNASMNQLTSEPVIRRNTSSHSKQEDNISIDYDDIQEYANQTKTSEGRSNIEKKDSLKSQFDTDDMETDSSNNNLLSNLSQNSEIFDLTDKELDYSLQISRYDNIIDNYNVDFGGISVMDSITGLTFENPLQGKKSVIDKNRKVETFHKKDVTEINKETFNNGKTQSVDNEYNNLSPSKNQNIKTYGGIIPVVTPNNSKYIIKTNEISPMLDYVSMTTPQRNKELDKYGLRPFKRKRAIQILTHLYNQTHPIIESCLDNDEPSPSKKLRQSSESPSHSAQKLLKLPIMVGEINKTSPQKETIISKSKSPMKNNGASENSPKKSTDNLLGAYEITSEIPIIKNIHCGSDDWVFQKKEKARFHTCRVPLHIAFHNYVSSRRSLREAILKYEPINIDIVHKDLVSYGHRYDPKDLLRYLDKKCITVKTVDNNARNKRY